MAERERTAKEVLTSKRQSSFYQERNQKLGYELVSVKKTGTNRTLTFEKRQHLSTDIDDLLERQVEEKLRLIEITDRKRCGFKRTYLNLLLHVALFCIQGAVLYSMALGDAHPAVMLRVGILLFWAFLLVGFCLKMRELFRWNRTIRDLKQQVLQAFETPPMQQPQDDLPIISVLFTRNRGWSSELIYWVSGRQYTHASLGLGDQTECFYSFDARGFRVEHPGHRKVPSGQRESLCYQFRVTREEYDQIEAGVQAYLERKDEHHYNTVGAVFGILRIYQPFKGPGRYFCSEFVSEQLKKHGSFHLKRTANMYFPTNLARDLTTQDNLYRVLVNEI